MRLLVILSIYISSSFVFKADDFSEGFFTSYSLSWAYSSSTFLKDWFFCSISRSICLLMLFFFASKSLSAITRLFWRWLTLSLSSLTSWSYLRSTSTSFSTLTFLLSSKCWALCSSSFSLPSLDTWRFSRTCFSLAFF